MSVTGRAACARRTGLSGRTVLLGTALLVLLGGCAGGAGPAPGGDPAGRIQQCKAGDERVASEADCLQDDAACYALANGDYCTGERGNSCPAGSVALPTGAPCPPGARCFAIAESLTCTIALD